MDLTDLLSMDFDEADFQRYRLEDGDILLNERQSTELVGRPAMWRNEIPDLCFQNTLVRFRVDRSKLDRDYALAVFLEYLQGAAFTRISSRHCKTHTSPVFTPCSAANCRATASLSALLEFR